MGRRRQRDDFDSPQGYPGNNPPYNQDVYPGYDNGAGYPGGHPGPGNQGGYTGQAGYDNPAYDGPDRQYSQGKQRKKKKDCIPNEVKALAALVSLGLATFDLATDINMVTIYSRVERSYLLWAMVAVVFISAILFGGQIYAFYLRMRAICLCCVTKSDEERRKNVAKKRENQYSLCNEITSYMLLIFEDGPSAVVLFFVMLMPAIMKDNKEKADIYCELYTVTFVDGFAGKLSLWAMAAVAVWKFLLSFFYCCQCCCKQWGGIKGSCCRCCCCMARMFRPLWAIGLLFVVGVIVYDLNVEIEESPLRLPARVVCDTTANGTAYYRGNWRNYDGVLFVSGYGFKADGVPVDFYDDN